MLDPVMEKQFIIKGKKMSVNVSDKVMDFDPKFMMYFITRLPNPSFSPELQAKVRWMGYARAEQGVMHPFFHVTAVCMANITVDLLYCNTYNRQWVYYYCTVTYQVYHSRSTELRRISQ